MATISMASGGKKVNGVFLTTAQFKEWEKAGKPESKSAIQAIAAGGGGSNSSSSSKTSSSKTSSSSKSNDDDVYVPPPPTYKTVAPGVHNQITKQLDPGMTDPQVKLLQQFLNANGFPVAPAGQPGSAGMETDYFGPATVAALQKYQKARGIVTSGDPASTGYGRVGPQTLSAIKNTGSQMTYDQGQALSSYDQLLGKVVNKGTVGGQTYELRNGVWFKGGTGDPVLDPNVMRALYDTYGNAPNADYLKQTGAIDPNAPPPPTSGVGAGQDQYAGMEEEYQAWLDKWSSGDISGGGTGTEGGPLGGSPYFMGNYSLVRFSGQGPAGYMNEGTVWLVDPSTKTLRPFENASSLANFFDGPVNMSGIQVVSAAELMPGGLLGSQNGQPGYEVLSNDYAIKSDGSAKRLDYSASQLASRYGHAIDQTAEQNAAMVIDGFLDSLDDTNSGIDEDIIKDLKNNSTQLAFYINAMAYGGYSFNDIYRDIKARELGIEDEISPISATATRSEYQKTDDGREAITDSRITPPAQIGGLTGTDLNLSLYDLPDEAFKTLVPILDFDSDEFKERMNEIESAYHDILLQQVNAGTEQEKAVADYNWEQFRSDLAKTYGIQLSNNALEAWGQIQNAYDQFSNRNIFNSGLQNEAIDSYLQRVRRGDQRLRDEEVTQEERERMNYYLKFATPQQIKDLAASEPELAKKWGLVPSDEVKSELTLAALKAKYPDEDEATLQRYITSILDENGNYRSNLFQRQMSSTQDIESDKRLYQQQMVYEQALRDEEKAYKEFTMPDTPFLRATDRDDENVQAYIPQTPDEDVNLSSQIKQAGMGLSQSSVQRPDNQAATNPTTPAGLAAAQKEFEAIQDKYRNAQATKSSSSYTAPITGYAQSNAPTVKAPTQYVMPKLADPQVNWSATGAPKPNMSTPQGPAYASPSGNISYTPTQQNAYNYNSPITTTHANSTAAVGNKSTGVVSALSDLAKKGWNKLTSFF